METTEKDNKSGKKDHSKAGAVVILIISAAVFVFAGGTAGITSLMEKRNTPVFGSYKGKNIEYKQGSRILSVAGNTIRLYEEFKINVNDEQRRKIFENAYVQTVEELYAADHVKKADWSAPKEAVNREMLPSYTNKATGKYDQRIFNQATEAQKNLIHDNAVKNLTRRRYIDDIVGSDTTVGGSTLYGVKPSSKEAAFVAGLSTEKHSFEIAAFSTNDLPESEIKSFGQSNKEMFTKYDLSAITASTEESAKSILNRIKNNEITFEDAVKDPNTSLQIYTNSEGKVSNSYQYQLARSIPEEAALTAVTSLANSAISEVVKTAYGWTIFRCDSDSKAADLDNADIIAAVKSYILSNEASIVEDYWTKQAQNLVTQASITSFAEACESAGVSKVDVPAFPVNYNGVSFYEGVSSDVTELASLKYNAEALQKLFSLKFEQVSEPIVLGSNIIVAKCVGIQFDDAAESDSYNTNSKDIDGNILVNTIMTSPDLKDNFYNVYNAYFRSNN